MSQRNLVHARQSLVELKTLQRPVEPKQYASYAYCELLAEYKIIGSMSAKGIPYDNAFAERFMRTLKYEEVYLCGYETILDVQENLPRFINTFYNEERVHSKLGYLTPSEFEQLLESDKQKTVRQPLRL